MFGFFGINGDYAEADGVFHEFEFHSVTIPVNVEYFAYFLIFYDFEENFLFEGVKTDFGSESEFDFLFFTRIYDEILLRIDGYVVFL